MRRLQVRLAGDAIPLRNRAQLRREHGVECDLGVEDGAALIQLDVSVRADHDGRRVRVDAVAFQRRTVVVNRDRKFKCEIARERLDEVVLLLGVDPDQHDLLRFALEPRDVALKLRHLGATRPAPRREEIDDDHFAADVVGEMKGGFIAETRQFEVVRDPPMPCVAGAEHCRHLFDLRPIEPRLDPQVDTDKGDRQHHDRRGGGSIRHRSLQPRIG